MAEQTHDRLRLTVSGDGADDLSKRLDQFRSFCRSRRGLRIERQAEGFALSVDQASIEAVGPFVEAAADAAGLRVVIDELEAEIRSAGPDGWASAVWAAIGNAVDEDDVIATRGQAVPRDPFRHLRVDDVDGTRVAVDARPPLADPAGAGPPDLGPQKFDDVGWHEGAALDAGQPPEYAFTHIGIYLTWLIRHDLHDPKWFPRHHIQAVKSGSMTGSDLADDIDGKLISDQLTDEGAGFTAARYERYMGDFDDLIGTDAVYRIPEDDALYARVGPLIDRLYADWVTAGRPAPEPKPKSSMEMEFDAMLEAANIPWDEIAGVATEDLAEGASGVTFVEVKADGSYDVRRPALPHEDPDLETMIDDVLPHPMIEISSVSATKWGSSLLRRTLKSLGVRPDEAFVATGIGRGESTVTVTLYRVPGASRAQLGDAFASLIDPPPGSSWSRRSIEGTTVSWAGHGRGFGGIQVAFWAQDELVFHVTGSSDDLDALIRGIG